MITEGAPCPRRACVRDVLVFGPSVRATHDVQVAAMCSRLVTQSRRCALRADHAGRGGCRVCSTHLSCLPRCARVWLLGTGDTLSAQVVGRVLLWLHPGSARREGSSVSEGWGREAWLLWVLLKSEVLGVAEEVSALLKVWVEAWILREQVAYAEASKAGLVGSGGTLALDLRAVARVLMYVACCVSRLGCLANFEGLELAVAAEGCWLRGRCWRWWFCGWRLNLEGC
jgi:hypothetical protein